MKGDGIIAKYCENDRRCSVKPKGPCALWAACPIFIEGSAVKRILEARAADCASNKNKKLQSTAKNKV